MKIKFSILLSLFILLLIILSTLSFAASSIMILRVDGVIGPITTEYIVENLQQAKDSCCHLVIIEMDTPGGLVSSTKEIVAEMLSCPVPLVVYISPRGAGAVSAGSFITLAAHIAAMTPGTNIGAAHPVALGFSADTSQVMSQKVTNHLVSFMKNIAESRNRNVDLAEKMVRESASFTEKEALKNNLIDFISPSLDSLLLDLHQKSVTTDSGVVQLDTRDAKIITITLTWRQRILQMLSNPNIAYIFVIMGLMGIYFELSNPGAILPGVVGVFCLIVGFYATEVLTVNWAGFLLLLLAFILFLLEIKITSYGLLTIGGITAMLLGSIMLFKAPIPILKISWSIVLTTTITTALFFIFAIGLALKAQRRPVVTGKEELIGMEGCALTALEPGKIGSIKIKGEIWDALATSKVASGDKIRVETMKGLVLNVQKI